MLITATSHANMKKGSIGAKGTKTYSFTTSSDGPCTASLIYDSATADLDTGFSFSDTSGSTILCYSVSAQKNFDSCSIGLPPNTYEVFVSSYKGSSNFRLVVNCGGQEQVGAAAQQGNGVELREVEPNQKLQQKLERIATAIKD